MRERGDGSHSAFAHARERIDQISTDCDVRSREQTMFPGMK
jgi:hypothetical protein